MPDSKVPQPQSLKAFEMSNLSTAETCRVRIFLELVVPRETKGIIIGLSPNFHAPDRVRVSLC